MVLHKENTAAKEKILNLLKAKKCVILPCDTIYGIIGVYPNTEEQIRAIKGRQRNKPFIVLVSSADEASALCGYQIDPVLTRYWPGPLTLILRVHGDGTLGLRVPMDPFLLDLLKTLREPVFSTSVNRSGDKPLNTVSTIVKEFADDVSLIVDGGDLHEAQPSTIVDATKKPYSIVRQGNLKVNLQ